MLWREGSARLGLDTARGPEWARAGEVNEGGRVRKGLTL